MNFFTNKGHPIIGDTLGGGDTLGVDNWYIFFGIVAIIVFLIIPGILLLVAHRSAKKNQNSSIITTGQKIALGLTIIWAAWILSMLIDS